MKFWRSGNGNGNGGSHDTATEEIVIHKTPDDLGVPKTLNYPNTTLGRLLDQTVERFSDSTALLYGDLDWNYGELLSQVNRLAGGLARIGVRRGDRVLMTLPNCPEFITSFFAIQKLGATVVNAGPLMGADDLGKLITMTNPRAIVGLDLQVARLAKLSEDSSVEKIVWLTLQHYQNLFKRVGYMLKKWQLSEKHDTSREINMAELLETAPPRPPTINPEPDDIAVLQPTGGTTGTLKVAQLSHRNLIANAIQLTIWTNCPPGQGRFMAVLPMFHVFGLTSCLMIPVFTGGAIIPLTRFVPSQVIDTIAKHKPTIFTLVPAICDGICNALERSGKTPESMKDEFKSIGLCVSGAAPLSREMAQRFEEMAGIGVIQGYGMTESSPVTIANLPGEPVHETIGFLLPDTLARLADLDDPSKDAPHGEAGELLVAGPQVMSGYFDNPEQTAAMLWRDTVNNITWLRTGDIAIVEHGGYFKIVDRKKDMIIRSGFNIYPAKVEDVIRKHSLVTDVAVVGKPDATTSEQVVAVVVLSEQPEDLEPIREELKSICREHLGRYEVPAMFEFIEQLPRNGLGKLLKNKLKREIFEKQAEEETETEEETVEEKSTA